MKKDFKRMLCLWGMINTNISEIQELFELCSKYPDIDVV